MSTGGEAYTWFILNNNNAKYKLSLRRAVSGMARERERTNGTVRQIGYILEQKHSWSPPLFVRHRPLLQDADERQEYRFNTINDTRHYIPFCYYRRASITALFLVDYVTCAQFVASIYTV